MMNRHVALPLMTVVSCAFGNAAMAAAATPAPATVRPQGASAGLGYPREAFDTQVVDKWQANGSEGLWIRTPQSRWLYATFQAPCKDLPTSVSARFRWSLSEDLRVGAAVMTAAGTVCEVQRIDEVSDAGSTTPLDGGKSPPRDSELEGVFVEGREALQPGPQDVPRCGLRAIVWALTRPGSAWRLISPVESTGPASACLNSSPAGDAGQPAPAYRWSSGTIP